MPNLTVGRNERAIKEYIFTGGFDFFRGIAISLITEKILHHFPFWTWHEVIIRIFYKYLEKFFLTDTSKNDMIIYKKPKRFGFAFRLEEFLCH